MVIFSSFRLFSESKNLIVTQNHYANLKIIHANLKFFIRPFCHKVAQNHQNRRDFFSKIALNITTQISAKNPTKNTPFTPKIRGKKSKNASGAMRFAISERIIENVGLSNALKSPLTRALNHITM